MHKFLILCFIFFSFHSFSQSDLLRKPRLLQDMTDPLDLEEQEESPEQQDVKDIRSAEEHKPETWGAFDPGTGVLLGKNELGSINLSFYILARYLNQQPPRMSFTDHLGNKRPVDTRNDIELHRAIVWLRGWAYDPKLEYVINFWTVNTTKNVNIIGAINYNFDKKFILQAGIDGLPGARSLNGQHPYFLSGDRFMGDEFFKPGFTMGVSARGQLTDSLFYRLMVGNALSEVGIKASQFTRNMAYGGSVWVLPTGEFGPRGGYGDYEMHDKLSTRYGISITQSREDRFAQPDVNDNPNNTQLRLSDSVNLFDTGALAPGVTIQRANYTILSADGAAKYRGFFFDFNYYWRWLDGFKKDGPTPQDNIFDHGFMLQSAYQIVPKKWEIYTSYTYIWGEFNNPWEVVGGFNYYPRPTRNWRLNVMVNHVEQSPVSSFFGFYTGGQTGETVALSTDIFF